MKANVTKEQLIEWRSKGYSYDQIAQIMGISPKGVGHYVRKFGLSKRKVVTDQDKKQFCEMYQDGYSADRIAELTGFAYSTIYHVINAAGLIRDKRIKFSETEDNESDMFAPQIRNYAKPKKRTAFRTVISGKSYIDITDFYINS
ncbi:MAG: hypothetical protein HDR71_15480 [Lachnospiraceae bacterium]|nr:hypothetical protein [Lachnospiraceae bacterium]